jgi:CRP-like cAMP-binding protein
MTQVTSLSRTTPNRQFLRPGHANGPQHVGGGFKYQQLRNVGITHEKALQLAMTVKISSYDEGHVIYLKGARPDAWKFIISGLVAESVDSPQGTLMPISIYGEGTWFGEQSIVNENPCYADFVCISSTEVMSITSETVLELMAAQPDFVLYLTRLMAWRSQQTSEMLTLIKFASPCLRVVMGLSHFAEELTFHTPLTDTINPTSGVEIPVKQKLLADLCGVSRTIFSEYVQKLASEGWLRISYGKLEILSVHSWLAFSNKQRSRKFINLSPAFPDLLADLAGTTDTLVSQY